jgi:hypothetical protein
MMKNDLKKMDVRGCRKVSRGKNTWKFVQSVNHVEGNNNSESNNRSEQTHSQCKL